MENQPHYTTTHPQPSELSPLERLAAMEAREQERDKLFIEFAGRAMKSLDPTIREAAGHLQKNLQRLHKKSR